MAKIQIRFIASRSIIGWLIRFGTMSLLEHVETLSRDGQGWVGAHAWTGVQKRPLDWAGKLIRDYRYELEVTEAQFEAFHGFIEGMDEHAVQLSVDCRSGASFEMAGVVVEEAYRLL